MVGFDWFIIAILLKDEVFFAMLQKVLFF